MHIWLTALLWQPELNIAIVAGTAGHDYIYSNLCMQTLSSYNAAGPC